MAPNAINGRRRLNRTHASLRRIVQHAQKRERRRQQGWPESRERHRRVQTEQDSNSDQNEENNEGNTNPATNTNTIINETPGDDDLFVTITSDDPLADMELPAANSFLAAARFVRMKRGGTMQQAKQQVIANDTVVIMDLNDKVPLRYTAQAQTFDTSVVHRNEDTALRQCCATIYARYHYITETMIAKFLVPSRFEDHSLAREVFRASMMRWQTIFQTSVMKIYLEGAWTLVEDMGGLKVWSGAITAQRMKVFTRVWNSSKVKMAAAMLGQAGSAVPIGDIYSDKTPEHMKWQKFHRTVFVWQCEKVFELRVSSRVDKRQECFEFFKTMVATPQFKSLELGGIEKIPTKHDPI